MWKYSTAPPTNITIIMPKGMTVQPISSRSEPSICVASRPWRRRYFVAKTATTVKMRIVIATQTATRKMYRRSSQNACEDAAAGQSGKLSNILMRAALPPGFIVRAAPEQQEQHRPNPKNGQPARELNDPADDCAVFPGVRIIVVAIQNHLIGQGSNLALRSLNQPQPQVLWRKFHAIVILGDLALGSQDHNGGRVRELTGLGIVLVLKSRGLGQCVN